MEIVFTCGPGGPAYPWNDLDAERGIGGSEECVILLTRELAKLGHKVVVYNNCAGKTGFSSGVEYRNWVFYDKLMKTDVLVAWRNWHLLVGKEAEHKWLWCHDIPAACHCPSRDEMERDNALNYIGKFILLNNYHKGIYMDAGVPEDKIIVSRIGVDPTIFDVDVTRDAARVLYFSHPGRGLDNLRAVWPDVKRSVPEAVLASFWWEPEHFRPEDMALGILPMRKLGHREVGVECMKAGVFGYPCVFAPEISPATTIKAQMGGAIPVVVMQGGMVDTVEFGVKTSQQFFANELISALKMSIAGDLEDERATMMATIRQKYSWETVAREWSANW